MSTDLDSQVIDFVQRVTSAMGLSLSAEREEADDNVRLNFTGDGAEVLLRRKGEALDALQVIVNTAFRRDTRGDRHYIIDALDYRKGKDAEPKTVSTADFMKAVEKAAEGKAKGVFAKITTEGEGTNEKVTKIATGGGGKGKGKGKDKDK